MIHSFLMIGQSNMAGRGNPGEVEPIINDKIQVLRNGKWRKMYVPVNADRESSGINLAESFADEYNKKFNVEVGLIPCADGGASLDQWQPGSLLFDHAVYQAKLAQRTSTIAGILWHQGESDCDEIRYNQYEKKFLYMVDEFRRILNLYDVPFITGELGYFLKNRDDRPYLRDFYAPMNELFKKISEENELIGLATAEGLESKGDDTHFSSRALREFGVRYFNEHLRLYRKDKVFTEKSNEYKMQSDLELL